MNWYDAVMVVLVILGMVWGAWRGITWQLASIASLVVGYLVASPVSAQLASGFPGEPIVARSLAMLVVYAGVSGGIFLVAWVIRATLRRLRFQAYDRHLGMVLGGLEGGLIGIVVTLFLVSLAPQTREPVFESPSGRLVGHVLDAFGPVLPAEVRNVLTPFWTDSPEAQRDLAESGSRRARGRFADLGSLDEMDTESMFEPDDSPTLGDLVREGRSRFGRAAGQALNNELQKFDSEAPAELSGIGQAAGQALERSIETGEATGAFQDFANEGRGQIGRAAGRILRGELQQYEGSVPAELSGISEAAGQALERSVQDGEASHLRGLIDQGRSRMGRAATRALEDQLQRVNSDGQDHDARRR